MFISPLLSEDSVKARFIYNWGIYEHTTDHFEKVLQLPTLATGSKVGFYQGALVRLGVAKALKFFDVINHSNSVFFTGDGLGTKFNYIVTH